MIFFLRRKTLALKIYFKSDLFQTMIILLCQVISLETFSGTLSVIWSRPRVRNSRGVSPLSRCCCLQERWGMRNKIHVSVKVQSYNFIYYYVTCYVTVVGINKRRHTYVYIHTCIHTCAHTYLYTYLFFHTCMTNWTLTHFADKFPLPMATHHIGPAGSAHWSVRHSRCPRGVHVSMG